MADLNLAIDSKVAAYIEWDELMPSIEQYLSEVYDFRLLDMMSIRVLDQNGVMVNPKTLRIQWQKSEVKKMGEFLNDF